MGNCQAADAAAVVIQHQGDGNIEILCGWKKEIVPCVFVRDHGVPASSYTVEMSCTYMASCVAAEQEASFGKVERLHWPATAADVMRWNPGHYVALVVLHHVDAEPDLAVAGEGGGARITKIKVLKPKDTLLLGQVYRLITSQEVSKAVQTRKQERMRGCDEAIEQERPRRQPPRPRGDDAATTEQRQPADHEERKLLEKDRHHRSSTAARGRGRGRHWRPALQSITESSSSGHTDCEDARKRTT